jgi:hypothetical protein
MDRLDQPRDQQSVVHAARMMYRLYGDIFRSLPLDPIVHTPTIEEEMS